MRSRLTLVAALGVLALLGLVYLAKNDPEGGAPYPKCVFREVTGLHCAGCGSTRAVHALLQLEVGTAFGKNPLLVVALPFLVVGIAMEGAAWVLGDRYGGPRVRLSMFFAWLVPVLIFGFWILRNVPVSPFTLLAPH